MEVAVARARSGEISGVAGNDRSAIARVMFTANAVTVPLSEQMIETPDVETSEHDMRVDRNCIPRSQRCPNSIAARSCCVISKKWIIAPLKRRLA